MNDNIKYTANIPNSIPNADSLRQALIDTLRALPYADYLRTEHWQAVRTAALVRNRRCGACGSTDRPEVHHNNYDHLGCEQPEDLIVFCEFCHERFHEYFPEPEE